jgi:hypothetical protein
MYLGLLITMYVHNDELQKGWQLARRTLRGQLRGLVVLWTSYDT